MSIYQSLNNEANTSLLNTCMTTCLNGRQMQRGLTYHQAEQRNYTNGEHFLNAVPTDNAIIMHLRQFSFHAKKITNFGIVNTISIFTISRYFTCNLQIKLNNFFNTINFIMTTINNIWTL